MRALEGVYKRLSPYLFVILQPKMLLLRQKSIKRDFDRLTDLMIKYKLHVRNCRN